MRPVALLAFPTLPREQKKESCFCEGLQAGTCRWIRVSGFLQRGSARYSLEDLRGIFTGGCKDFISGVIRSDCGCELMKIWSVADW